MPGPIIRFDDNPYGLSPKVKRITDFILGATPQEQLMTALNPVDVMIPGPVAGLPAVIAKLWGKLTAEAPIRPISKDPFAMRSGPMDRRNFMYRASTQPNKLAHREILTGVDDVVGGIATPLEKALKDYDVGPQEMTKESLDSLLKVVEKLKSRGDTAMALNRKYPTLDPDYLGDLPHQGWTALADDNLQLLENVVGEFPEAAGKFDSPMKVNIVKYMMDHPEYFPKDQMEGLASPVETASEVPSAVRSVLYELKRRYGTGAAGESFGALVDPGLEASMKPVASHTPTSTAPNIKTLTDSLVENIKRRFGTR